jgi:hypothetical protein
MSNRPPYPRDLKASDVPLKGEAPVFRARDCETFYVSRAATPYVYIVRASWDRSGTFTKRAEGFHMVRHVVESFS